MTVTDALRQGLEVIHNSYPQAVDKMMLFSELLLEKNKVMNLTAVTDPMEVVTRHFLDCASAMENLHITTEKILDIGCGAGFPGMPTALLHPNAHVILLDSLGKRINFLQECIQELSISNAQAVHSRAEEYVAKHRETFDIVTSRAVARMNVLCELSLPFVKVNGCFAAMKSINCNEELQEAEKGIALLGGEVEAIQDYAIPFTEMKQRLVIVRKVKKTPVKYPRRFHKIVAVPL